MPHLLLISTNHPTPWEPHKGPAQAALVEALRRISCRVTVIAPVPWTERLRPRRPADMTDAKYPVYWYLPRLLRHHYHRTLDWSLRSTLARVTASSPAVNAVLACWAHPDGTVAVQHARQRGIPAGIVAVGSDVMLLPADPSRREIIAATLCSADHVFGVGSEIVRRTIGFGVDPARVSNFIMGVNLDHFRNGNQQEARNQLGLSVDGPLLLWVGQMVDVKASERVILAARGLQAAHAGLQVAMVGSGPQEAMLRAVANASGALASRVTFPGAVASKALTLWYQAADVMVLPSRSEGVPNVLLEAMATGLPFVASDVGSIRELLPFGPSRVVPEGDLEQLQEAIAAVLADPDRKTILPRRYDILDGAREIMRHLHLDRA